MSSSASPRDSRPTGKRGNLSPAPRMTRRPRPSPATRSTHQRHYSSLEAADRIALAALAPRAGEMILVLGCGSGIRLPALARAHSIGVGVDPSLERLRAVKHIFPTSVVMQCDLQQSLPLASRCFDAVLCALSEEHLDRTRFVFREVFRVLRPQGRFVLSLFYPTVMPRAIGPDEERREPSRSLYEIDFELRAGPFRRSAKDYATALLQTGFSDIRQHRWSDGSRSPNTGGAEAESSQQEFPSQVVLQALRSR